MKEAYRYYRNEYDKPLVTECALYNDDRELLALGYAVCSPKDQCQKAIGRNIAKQRAYYALKMYESVALPIQKSKILRSLVYIAWNLPPYKAIKVQSTSKYDQKGMYFPWENREC
jgi:hypothetical protein